jgi:ABC-type protease/lipase transport system fused ATPase/permease subunit
MRRLSTLLATPTPRFESDAPPPRGRLVVDSVVAGAPDRTNVLRGVSFTAEPGQLIAVVGPVGAGKSTLLRCVLGVWPLMNGSVRLDGAPLMNVDRDQIGRHLGFLPQNADLFMGTVAENIRRFGPPDPEGVAAAVQAAGAREAIAALTAGLDTEVGEAGRLLSAGQRRRIALARALYGDPVLVCLDEPEAHLDRDGETALRQALAGLKARGAIVLMAAHRSSVVGVADRVIVLDDGRMVQMGPASEILARLGAAQIRQVAP